MSHYNCKHLMYVGCAPDFERLKKMKIIIFFALKLKVLELNSGARGSFFVIQLKGLRTVLNEVLALSLCTYLDVAWLSHLLTPGRHPRLIGVY